MSPLLLTQLLSERLDCSPTSLGNSNFLPEHETLASLADEWVKFRARLLLCVSHFSDASDDPIDVDRVARIRQAVTDFHDILAVDALPLGNQKSD